MQREHQRQQAQAQTETESPLAPLLQQSVGERVRSLAATAAQFLGVEPGKVCALLRNVWKPSKGQPELTDSEMFAGLSMIARYALDPVAKEVYVTRTSKGLVTIIGIDGYVKILNRTEGYNGFEQELHFDDSGKDLEWVETVIYHKDREYPTKYRAFMSEYRKIAGPVAGQIPWHMLRLFSLRHAVRLFTPIGGNVVTEEEARWMDAYNPADVKQNVRSTAKERAAAMAKSAEPDLTAPIPDVPQEESLPDDTSGEQVFQDGEQFDPAAECRHSIEAMTSPSQATELAAEAESHGLTDLLDAKVKSLQAARAKKPGPGQRSVFDKGPATE